MLTIVCVLLQSCPVISRLDLAPLCERCVQGRRPEYAAILLPYLPPDHRRRLSQVITGGVASSAAPTLSPVQYPFLTSVHIVTARWAAAIGLKSNTANFNLLFYVQEMIALDPANQLAQRITRLAEDGLLTADWVTLFNYFIHPYCKKNGIGFF